MRFGIDRVDITPDYKTYMAGFGLKDLNDGINDPLTFTSLILEEKGKKVFIGAADLADLDREHSLQIRQTIAGLLKVKLADVMLNVSHTHGGMMVKMPDYFDRKRFITDDCERFLPIVKKNQKLLERKIVSSVKKAMRKMRNGKIYFGESKTAIPCNRRLRYRGRIELRPDPRGKTDKQLKILKITDSKNRLAAVITRLSCHPVATSAQHLITADYPGVYRTVFENYFPETMAIFWQGVGGDAHPVQTKDGMNWKQMKHSELHIIGECLFREVLTILTRPMVPLDNLELNSALKEVFIPLVNPQVERTQLENMLETAPDDLARLCIKSMLSREKIPDGMPFTVQKISLNRHFSMIGISAEVLCGLGRKLEQMIATDHHMVLGYTNGVFAYLPDKNEIKRGGYEASPIYELLPSAFSPELDEILMKAVSAI